MADNKVNFLRGTSAEYESSTKDNDTFYYTTDTKKLYLGENEVGNGIDPKVIQAHIDNQTIHAKVWKGTQEEYNAIEPKEDDTVYIIKDSDNTLADKLIDDTSTTATDKTWSAKKINENDEVARAAISAHAGNTEIHVTAEEKAAWNGKAELTDIPTTLPANGGNADTLDGKHKSDFVENMLNQNYHFSMVHGDHSYITTEIDNNVPNLPTVSNYIHIVSRRDNGEVETVLSIGADYTKNVYVYRKNDGIWKNLLDGGNADTVDGLHADDFVKTSHESYQIPIPNDVDVPIWIANNAKLYTRYYTCYENTGLTNVAGGDPNDFVWYYFDGINIIATCNMTKKVWIACVAGGVFIGWVQINTTSLPANGGNADTLESHPATDFVLKSDYDALAARVAALEGGTTS